MQASLSPTELTTWYREQSSSYAALAESVTSTLAGLCKARKVDYVTISHRVKALDSVIEKVSRKEYSSIDEITDVLGVRVITFVESDIAKVNKIISDAFRVHADQSGDKSEELAYNQVGYRSVHHICDLGETRLALPECAPFKGLKFEVQVRTVLQHAWAEIEHDRSYKFSGDLPLDLRRRMSLLAGTLELVDHEFSRLAQEIESYERNARKAAKSESIEAQEVTPFTVREYLEQRSPIRQLDRSAKNRPLETVIGELIRFGACTIADVDKLLTKDFLLALGKHTSTTTYVGLFRKAMMYADVEKYFTEAWNDSWKSLSSGSRDLLVERYGEARADGVLSKYLKRSTSKKPR